MFFRGALPDTVGSDDDESFQRMKTEKFPWQHLVASRDDQRLQQRHPVQEGKGKYLSKARACPKCQTPADQLEWFYFSSPEWTWTNLCGREGWAVVCLKCRVQVGFFCEMMS